MPRRRIERSNVVRSLAALLVCSLASAAAAADEALDRLVEKQLPDLVATYQMLHAAPELSGHEVKTSAYLAKRLRAGL